MMHLPPLDFEIKKIVLCEGDIETLGYFSKQLAIYFRQSGYEIYLFNFQDEINSMIGLSKFIDVSKTALVTFNFTGLIGETCFNMPDGTPIWDLADIYCINIVVDHPFYYHNFLKKLPKRYYQYCIDRTHLNYMRRFFPEITSIGFLPLAGTAINSTNTPLKDRPIDIMFTGNYTPPKTFEKDIKRLDDDYTVFYYAIINDLIENPEQTMDAVIEKHVKMELPMTTELELKDCFSHMIFIDLYVRFHFRASVVRTLVDSGFQVHVCGGGWDKLDCKHPENLIPIGLLDSKACLEQISLSKISLNVMPWFKDGAHDRVFNSLMNGAVCLSDPSVYLKTQLKDDEHLKYYHLEQLEQLPDIVTHLLKNPESMQKIADRGFEQTQKYHTWKQRAEVIAENIKNHGWM